MCVFVCVCVCVCIFSFQWIFSFDWLLLLYSVQYNLVLFGIAQYVRLPPQLPHSVRFIVR